MPKARKIEDENSQMHVSCGNVFEDLGLPNADILLLKADLRIRIMWIVEERKLRNKDAAEIWGVDSAEASHVLRGRFRGYSLERLFRFLLALGEDVEIITRPKPKSREKAELIHAATIEVKKIASAKRAAKSKKQTAPKRKAA